MNNVDEITAMDISEKEKAALLKAQLDAVESSIRHCFEEVRRIYGSFEMPYDSVGESLHSKVNQVWNDLGEEYFELCKNVSKANDEKKAGYLSGNH